MRRAIRLLPVWAAALAACGGGGAPATSPTTGPPPVAEPHASVPAVPAGFAAVRGWGPITWDMSEDQAVAATEAAGHPVHRVTLPKDGRELFEFASEPWKATCYVDRDSGKVHDCLLEREVADQAAAIAARAEVEALYGPPMAHRDPIGENGAYVTWASATSTADVEIRAGSCETGPCWVVFWRAETTAPFH